VRALKAAGAPGDGVEVSRTPIVVTIAGGKGGVGKSVVAANLAVLVARTGASTVLVDADLGAPNQHTFFGCERTPHTLQDFVEGRVASLEETFVPTGIAQLSLVAGQAGVPSAANPPHARKLKLARAIAGLDAEVVIVDLGAGTSHNVVDLFLLGHVRLLVVAPQLTSVQNAYALSKTALLRAFGGLAMNPAQQDAVAQAFERRALSRIDQGIATLATTEPALAARCRRATRGFSMRVIGNLIDGPKGPPVVEALSHMMRDYLGIDAPVVALVPRDEAMHRSVNRREVLATSAPDHVALRPLRTLVEIIVSTERDAVVRARTGGDWSERISLVPAAEQVRASRRAPSASIAGR
jgi:flagellar biosynthesis protein FlhG